MDRFEKSVIKELRRLSSVKQDAQILKATGDFFNTIAPADIIGSLLALVHSTAHPANGQRPSEGYIASLSFDVNKLIVFITACYQGYTGKQFYSRRGNPYTDKAQRHYLAPDGKGLG